MKLLKSTVVASIFLATCGASWADGISYDMPSIYLDGLNAKLIHAGYRGVRVVNMETNFLVAYDKDGSEVVLVAHPSNYKIVSSTYVHPFDN